MYRRIAVLAFALTCFCSAPVFAFVFVFKQIQLQLPAMPHRVSPACSVLFRPIPAFSYIFSVQIYNSLIHISSSHAPGASGGFMQVSLFQRTPN